MERGRFARSIVTDEGSRAMRARSCNDTGSPPSPGRRWRVPGSRAQLSRIKGRVRCERARATTLGPRLRRDDDGGCPVRALNCHGLRVACDASALVQRHWVPAFAGRTMQKDAIRVPQTMARHSRSKEATAHTKAPVVPAKAGTQCRCRDRALSPRGQRFAAYFGFSKYPHSCRNAMRSCMPRLSATLRANSLRVVACCAARLVMMRAIGPM
jgi:hypothetical protein